MLNFGELKTQVAEFVQRSGDSDYKTKIGTWLKMSHQSLMDVYDYWTDLQATYTFTTVDGTEDYSMPTDFILPFRIFDMTNDRKLTIKTEEEYVESNIASVADATEGAPEFARIYGSIGSGTSIQKVLKLGLIPDDAYSMRVLYKKKASNFSADTDYPFTECDRFLTLDAAGWAFKQDNRDSAAEQAWARASDALSALLLRENNKLGPDYVNKILSKWAAAHRNVRG